MPVLNDVEIYRLARDSFGDLGRDAALIFGGICLAESGGKTDALYDNVAGGWQPEDSIYRFDRGLPQINSVHGYDAERLLSDPAYACWCARQIYNLQGFQAWSTYKGGQYRAFLDRMAKAELEAGTPEATAGDFQRGKEAGRTEMFYEGWSRDTLPVLREVIRVLTEHAEWIEKRPEDWGIQRGS